ncbi:hypothetical protein [Nonomuraea sp. SYSU D8015]|uniref:hypothetical protein n=1 Tax=Nonomuraea sp. SYSU D8015 TaxID=2593644 RepID=UPI00166146AB|nr:hypothetical protein [Nonomuraea sp. SYSU D8015]
MSGAHYTPTGRLPVALPPEEAFTLFTPRGEERWVAAWRPRFPVETATSVPPAGRGHPVVDGRAARALGSDQRRRTT